jgi:glycosyltransferase involved in cell wall biosynthesis
MIIGVDGNEANVEKKVGTSVYTYELLHYFQHKANEETQFIVYLRESPNDSMPQEKQFYRYEIVKGNFLWSQLFFPLYLYTHKRPDVLFCPAHYIPRACPVKTVVTIHDLAYFYYDQEFLKKDLYQLKNWTQYAINKSSKVIAVSKATAKDIRKFYKTSDDKISIIYNGFNQVEPEKKHSTDTEKLIKHPYFLYVGTIQPRKNISLLIEAFNALVEENPNLHLIIVGKKGWLYKEIFEKITQMHLEEHVTFTGFIDDSDLDYLYKHAISYILPSLYEGFGIPVLEAMSRSCPVIISFNSSLPEVGGDAALYFDPSSPEDLYQKMLLIKDNLQLRKDLVIKGQERVKLFSWDKCGQETLQVLQSIYHER